MGFWIFMLCSNFLIPLLMIGFGYFFKKFGAGTINDVFGYRTSMSKKNQQTWDFANMYFARLWIKVGFIMLPLSIVLMFPVLGKSTDTVGWWGAAISLVQCVVLLASIFPVERALNKNFDKDGNPKKQFKFTYEYFFLDYYTYKNNFLFHDFVTCDVSEKGSCFCFIYNRKRQYSFAYIYGILYFRVTVFIKEVFL